MPGTSPRRQPSPIGDSNVERAAPHRVDPWGLPLEDPVGAATYVQAFALMPLPALLFDDVRLVAANRAAEDLLGSLEEPVIALRAIRMFISRPRAITAGIRIGLSDFRLTTTPLSRYSGLRLCLLFKSSRADGLDPHSSWSLTLPEKRVALSLEQGLRNRDIAEQLGISVETVRKHVAHILAKSGARTRAAFVGMVLRSPAASPLGNP